MLRSRFPGKPNGRSQSAKARISTGHVLRQRRGQSEAGTSGLHEVENIERGYKNFLEFCGDSDEVSTA